MSSLYPLNTIITFNSNKRSYFQHNTSSPQKSKSRRAIIRQINPCSNSNSKQPINPQYGNKQKVKNASKRFKSPLETVSKFQQILDKKKTENPSLIKQNEDTLSNTLALLRKKSGKHPMKKPIYHHTSINPRNSRASRRKSTPTKVINLISPNPASNRAKPFKFPKPLSIATHNKLNQPQKRPLPKSISSNLGSNKAKPLKLPKSSSIASHNKLKLNQTQKKIVPKSISNAPKTELLELFGRKTIVTRKDGTEKSDSEDMKKSNRRRKDRILNVKYVMNEEQHKKIREKFDHKLYVDKTGKKLQCDDKYFYWHQPNDYKLVKQVKESRKNVNMNKNNNYNQSSKLKQLFFSILNQHDNGECNNIDNYKFIKHRFPDNQCLDCLCKLKVIPLAEVGDGYIEDHKSESGEYKIGIYKVAAICSNYPKCKFPLNRPSYSQCWIKSAWFDDRLINKNKNDNSNSNKRKRSLNDTDNKENIIESNPSKKRKLDNNNNNKFNNNDIRNNIYRGMQSVNSYDYLKSLSNIKIFCGVEGHQFNEKNLNRFNILQNKTHQNVQSDDQQSDTISTISNKSNSLSTLFSQSGSSSNIILK